MTKIGVVLCRVLLLISLSNFAVSAENEVPESTKPCSIHADCGTIYCTCAKVRGFRTGFCLHSDEYVYKLDACPICTGHFDCGTNDLCRTTAVDGKKRCLICQAKALQAGAELCAEKPATRPKLIPLEGIPCETSSQCSSDCSCNKMSVGRWCTNEKVLDRERGKCQECQSGKQCPDISGCSIPLPGHPRWCQTCVMNAILRSVNKCKKPTQSTPSTPSPESSRDACFPGDAKVELHTKKIIPMSHLRIGDRIAVGRGLYSQVFMFTHAIPYNWYSFVVLATASGHRIKLTSSHFIYVNGNLKPASTVRVGDVLTLSDGIQSRVTSVQHAVERGLFNPQTEHGDIVVDGIIVSTYTSTVSPKIAHAAVGPVRALYVWLGITTKFLESYFDYIVQGKELKNWL